MRGILGAMPEQDLEVLTRLYAAFNDRDMPGMLECMDPAIEVSAPEGLEYAAVMMRLLGPRGVVLLDKYRGHDEVRRLYEALWSISAHFTVHAEEFVRHGRAVVVPATLRAATADAGTEGEVHVAHLWTLGGGKVTSLRIYVDAERARAAASMGGEEEEE
jgi:ketosteroid isomerase-like protein